MLAKNVGMTISDLASRLGLDFLKLKLPINRLKTRNIGVDLDQKQVNILIRYFSKEAVVPEPICKFIINQFEQYHKVVSSEEVAKENLLSKRDFRDFVKGLNKNEKFVFLKDNIFAKTEFDAIKKTKIKKLVSLFLKSKISKNIYTSAFVHTFDSKTKQKVRAKINIHLLEGIRTKTWMQGQVVGFYNLKHQDTLPIVALYNGNIEVVDAVKHDPRNRKPFTFIPRQKGKKQPVIWAFNINKLVNSASDHKKKDFPNQDHRLFHFINMLMETLNDKKISCEFTNGGNPRDPYIKIVSDSVTFDINKFNVSETDTKKEKESKIKTYGIPNLVNIEENIYFFTSKKYIIVKKNSRENKAVVVSNSVKIQAGWLPKKDIKIMKGLQEIEGLTGIPVDILVGELLTQWYEAISASYKLEVGCSGSNQEILSYWLRQGGEEEK